MRIEKKPIKCFIASIKNHRIDSFLDKNGFSKGVISFAIPEYGILFRCQSYGTLIDMEFGVFFSLLQFNKSSLKKEKTNNIHIYSSNPEFVFSFTNQSKHLHPESSHRILLNKYSKEIKMAVSYVKPIDNKALISPADYPSVPINKKINLNFHDQEMKKIDFKPFQKGIKL